MGKARVLGNNCIILLQSSSGLPIPIGEVDNFSAKSSTSVIKSRPIGFVKEGTTLKYGGYDISFDGGKVDWSLAHFTWLQDAMLLNSEAEPTFSFSNTIIHYDGSIESYVYEDVTLFGLDFNASAEEITEKMEGFAPSRRIGVVDTTYGSNSGTNLIREVIFDAKRKENARAKVGDVSGIELTNNNLA